MEYVKQNKEEASSLFDQLLREFPDYIPTYYQAGLWYLNKQQRDKAFGILQNGLSVCQQQNDTKTYAEIKLLLDE
ncbi:MAG: hypothetical protein HC811_01760 [Flammeovirgaceae bacterium]|nr:hypothetical protein [Flammeovirgaceae bacterium]